MSEKIEDTFRDIEEIAKNSLYAYGITGTGTIKYSYEIFKRFIKSKKTLELGPAEGVMTDLLVRDGHEVTCVEGSKKFSEELKKKYPNVRVYYSLFEDFLIEESFDNIILGHVLEHVDDPAKILLKCQNWMNTNSIILSAVPNAYSIHRQAAVLMKLLSCEKAMSELDIHHGHKKVFDPFEFRQLFLDTGFKILIHGGYWLKPLSNRQIEDCWTEEMLLAFMQLGERYPDIAAEQYIVAQLNG